jgi:hypothetical protein
MGDQVIPPWGDDPLSKLISHAQENERISSLKMADVYSLLQQIHAAFERLLDVTEKGGTLDLLPSRLLMARARGAWLAAVRLGMSGLTVEAYPLLRVVVENTWYALHMAKKPASIDIWIKRRESALATAQCQTEFSIRNVRTTHMEADAKNAGALQRVYERTIELGGHPNELAVLGSTERSETDEAYLFDVSVLSGNELFIMLALKIAVEAAVGALRAFHLIFPHRFELSGLDGDIQKLADGHNTVFKAYIARARAETGR